MSPTFRWLVLIIVLGPTLHADQREFGGSFQELRPEQQRVVIEIVSRFNSSTGQSLTPQHVYDGARISVRSTFEAVTQALLATKLTSKSGTALGNALQLVDVVEDVAGEFPGRRGDQQFRIYAAMKPGAITKLEDSDEFFRDKDNRRYHKGFPVCFRMTGIPSIQVSLTRDGKRADIDVDYRSPKFPNGLVNGHLRAANSDVRAGNNGGRHNERWSGLSEWWKMLFGFDFGPQSGKEDVTRTTAGIPPSPRVGTDKGLDAAVQDFLAAWLLEAQARFAVPYFSVRSYPCLEAISENRGRSVPAGVIRYELLNAMGRYAKAIGPVRSLNEVVSPVKLWDASFRPYKNKYESQFTIFAVPTAVATTQDCSGSPPGDAVEKTKVKYGEYFGSGFRLHDGELNQGILYLLWTKQYKYWQIVSAQYVESDNPGLAKSTTPEPTEEEIEVRTVVGDKEANESIRSFLINWLLKGDFKAAASFVAPAAHACFDEPLDPARDRQAFMTGLAQIREALGRRTALVDYLEAFIPNDLTSRIVRHPDQKAYVILSPSRQVAETLLCTGRDHLDRPAEVTPGEQDFGRYYVTAFRMKVQDGEAAAFYTLWAREKDAWKIVAWQLIAP